MSCLCDSGVALPSRPWYVAAWSPGPSGLMAPSEDTEAEMVLELLGVDETV